MTSFNFSLNIDNIKDIPFDKYFKDFTFIVDGKRYETSRIIADILSPTIRKNHFNDSSCHEFVINARKNGFKEDSEIDYFKDFLQLSSLQEIEVDQQKRQIYSEYFYQLGNFDAFYSILYDNSKEVSEEQSIKFFQQISKCDFLPEINFENEQIQIHIKNVSEHFSEIDKSELKRIKVEILERILREKALQLNDEDSLLSFICELYNEDQKYADLFEYVEFREVTEKVLKEFIDTFSIDYMNCKIWNKISERLIPSFIESQKISRTYKKEEYTTEYKEFKYNEGENFNGIIKYLTNKTGGNVHDNKTIEVTSNSLYDNYKLPKYVVDYESNTGFFSKDEDGTFLCFDFKDKIIQITNYSIESYGQEKNMCHPKNWVAEVSEDGSNWIEIDRHIDDPSLNEHSITVTFKVQKEMNGFYRYFRILQTGISWDERSNHFYFGIRHVELYGKLKEFENK